VSQAPLVQRELLVLKVPSVRRALLVLLGHKVFRA